MVFGSENGSGFFTGDFGAGLGGGFLIEPDGRPKYLQINNPEYQSAFTAGFAIRAEVVARGFGAGIGGGWEGYSGVGVQQTSQGLDGCYDETEGSFLGNRETVKMYGEPYDYSSLDPTKLRWTGWGTEWVVKVGFTMGFSWKW